MTDQIINISGTYHKVISGCEVEGTQTIVAIINCDQGRWYRQEVAADGFGAHADYRLAGPRLYNLRTDLLGKG